MNRKKSLVFFAFAVTVVILISTSAAEPSSGKLEIHIIDVGQGDAILISSPAGDTILIDAGGNYSGDEVIAFMQDHNIPRLDYMLSSHYHADHIGGSDYVLYQLPAGLVYDRGGTYNSQTFLDYIEAAGDKRKTINVNDTIYFGSGVTVTVVQSNFGSTENNKSIVLKVSYGEFDGLFGGDCEEACEASLNIGDIEFYKVHHHGSKTSSSWAFLQQITPELSVISVGADNAYGHPHTSTLENLQNIGSKICRTDVDGSVSIYTDGQTFWYGSTNNPEGCATTGGNGKGGGKGGDNGNKGGNGSKKKNP